MGPFPSLPPPGYDESQTVARLRTLATDTPDPLSPPTFGLRAAFRFHGTAAAREVRDPAPGLVRRGSVAQTLLQYCCSIGSDAGVNTPEALLRLLHDTVPVTWPRHWT